MNRKSMYVTKPLKDKKYNIKVPPSNAFKIETPDDCIKMHTITLAVAKRGTGKSVALTNLLRILRENNAMDRILLISPTYFSNKDLFDSIGIQEEDIFDEPNDKAIEDVIKIVEEENDDYEEYHSKMKRYKKLMGMLDRQVNIFEIPADLLLEFAESDFQPPEHKYNGKKPVIGLLLDDIQGSNLFRTGGKFMSFAIRHRHVGKGLGCSIFMACQNYISPASCPRAVRNNLTHMLLFRNKDIKTLSQIASEFGGEIDEETFMSVYNEATRDSPHDFLFIDTSKKDSHPSMFRKNFDRFIVPDPKLLNPEIDIKQMK